MVETVALLLEGRGHRVIRAREAGLGAEDDAIVAEYALIGELVIVTFEPDFRRRARRGGPRCLHIRTPERTARERLAGHYREVKRHFDERAQLVTLPSSGEPTRDDGR